MLQRIQKHNQSEINSIINKLRMWMCLTIIRRGGRQCLPRMEVPLPWKLPWAGAGWSLGHSVVPPYGVVRLNPGSWREEDNPGRRCLPGGETMRRRWINDLEDPAEFFKNQYLSGWSVWQLEPKLHFTRFWALLSLFKIVILSHLYQYQTRFVYHLKRKWLLRKLLE